MEGYGFLSVLPVLTILVIAVTTKRTLFAMVCGLSVGALILAGGISGVVGTWFNYLYVSMTNETLQWLVLVIALFGMLIVLFERSHAVQDFGYWAGKFIHTKKQALLGTVVLGIIVFLDDYLNNLAVGTTMKGITDRLRIPRTQLAYTVNSVAAPVCVLIPLSSWAVYFGALLENEGIVGAEEPEFQLTFPQFRSFLRLAGHTCCDIAYTWNYPEVRFDQKDAERAELTGEVFPEGTDLSLIDSAGGYELPEGKKAHPWSFLIPLAIMIAVTLYAGSDVLSGALAGVISAAVLYGFERRLSVKELLTCCYDGVISMGFVIILSVLAFAVQAANTDLSLAEYVISVTEPIMHGAFLPAAVFLVCAVYAYATGCFWDLAAIITPIVVPLAVAMEVDPLLACAAVFSGAAFGSNTCLYGDGVILCSQGCQIKPIELMMATLPYALIAGGGSLILYLIAGFVM